MKPDKKQERESAFKTALENAAAMIDEHVGGGIQSEDVGCDIDLYHKQCIRVKNLLMNKADKLKHN